MTHKTLFIVARIEGDEGLVLFSSGGCGGPRQERVGVNSRTLRDMINHFCPVTHDFQPDFP